jgi:hypothetical protein
MAEADLLAWSLRWRRALPLVASLCLRVLLNLHQHTMLLLQHAFHRLKVTCRGQHVVQVIGQLVAVFDAASLRRPPLSCAWALLTVT